MAVTWRSPVEIDEQIAMCVQSMLANIGTFELTEENFEEFCKYNDEAKLLVHCGLPASHEALRVLIGFNYNY